jgi:hypothetical protein
VALVSAPAALLFLQWQHGHWEGDVMVKLPRRQFLHLAAAGAAAMPAVSRIVWRVALISPETSWFGRTRSPA